MPVLLLYLGVAKQYEPLLMVPIAFGALIANIPDNGMLISQMNQQVISSNEKGQVTATSLNNVGYLRVHVAPLQEAPVKVRTTSPRLKRAPSIWNACTSPCRFIPASS